MMGPGGKCWNLLESMQEITLSHSSQIFNFLLSITSGSLSVPATFQVFLEGVR